MRCSVAWLLTAPLGAIAGCNALFGIDGLSYDPTGTGTPVGGGGSTASGGSAGSAGQGVAGGGEGGGDEGGGGSAPALGPFDNVGPVAELNTQDDEDDPTFTDDGLELFFNTNRSGPGASLIWRSQRSSTTEPWGAPTQVEALDLAGVESNPVVSGDGLTMWLSARPTTGDYEIYRSTRPDRSAIWSTPSLMVELNSTDDDHFAAITADRRLAVLTSQRTGGLGGWDLWLAARSTASKQWDPPTLLSELDTSASEASAWLRSDGLEIYFSRGGGGSSEDVFRASRPDLASPFTGMEPVLELNLSIGESDPWVSSDGRYVMFARGTAPNRDLFEGHR